MDKDELFYLISHIIAGIGMGGFYGIIPLVAGIIRKKILMGIVCMVICVLFALSMLLLFNQPASWTLVLAAAMAGCIVLLTKNKKA